MILLTPNKPSKWENNISIIYNYVFLKLQQLATMKKIYDFNIESITGEIIDFKDYKNKVILVVNTAIIVDSQNSIMNYSSCGIYIKKMDW